MMRYNFCAIIFLAFVAQALGGGPYYPNVQIPKEWSVTAFKNGALPISEHHKKISSGGVAYSPTFNRRGIKEERVFIMNVENPAALRDEINEKLVDPSGRWKKP